MVTSPPGAPMNCFYLLLQCFHHIGVLYLPTGACEVCPTAVAGVSDIKILAVEHDGSLPLDLVRSDSILGYRRTCRHCPIETGFTSKLQKHLYSGPALLTARRGGMWLGGCHCISECRFYIWAVQLCYLLGERSQSQYQLLSGCESDGSLPDSPQA